MLQICLRCGQCLRDSVICDFQNRTRPKEKGNLHEYSSKVHSHEDTIFTTFQKPREKKCKLNKTCIIELYRWSAALQGLLWLVASRLLEIDCLMWINGTGVHTEYICHISGAKMNGMAVIPQKYKENPRRTKQNKCTYITPVFPPFHSV